MFKYREYKQVPKAGPHGLCQAKGPTRSRPLPLNLLRLRMKGMLPSPSPTWCAGFLSSAPPMLVHCSMGATSEGFTTPDTSRCTSVVGSQLARASTLDPGPGLEQYPVVAPVPPALAGDHGAHGRQWPAERDHRSRTACTSLYPFAAFTLARIPMRCPDHCYSPRSKAHEGPIIPLAGIVLEVPSSVQTGPNTRDHQQVAPQRPTTNRCTITAAAVFTCST